VGERYAAFRTAADVERRIGQGFGQGQGAGYRPWLRVQEVPPVGITQAAASVLGVHHPRYLVRRFPKSSPATFASASLTAVS
jgi:hypothetical protein